MQIVARESVSSFVVNLSCHNDTVVNTPGLAYLASRDAATASDVKGSTLSILVKYRGGPATMR